VPRAPEPPEIAMPLQSFPPGFRALVIGASGSIGAALVAALQADPRCATVIALGRGSEPALDLADPVSIERAANAVAGQGPFHLIIKETLIKATRPGFFVHEAATPKFASS